MENAPLQKELEFFKRNKAEYLQKYKSQFVVIKDTELIGSYTTESEAYKAGLEKFGNNPFLIKQVIDQEVEASFPALTVGVMNIHASI